MVGTFVVGNEVGEKLVGNDVGETVVGNAVGEVDGSEVGDFVGESVG